VRNGQGLIRLQALDGRITKRLLTEVESDSMGASLHRRSIENLRLLDDKDDVDKHVIVGLVRDGNERVRLDILYGQSAQLNAISRVCTY
jgi:hypothetical protein